jgi:hypothetical protein
MENGQVEMINFYYEFFKSILRVPVDTQTNGLPS